MSPTGLPPESGDVNMWGQVVAVAGRLFIRFILWIESALPIIVPAWVAAYLYGRNIGYRDVALRLFVATGVFVAVIGTPAALWALDLDSERWSLIVCSCLSAFCIKCVDWMEMWIVRKLEIERRNHEGK